MPEVTIGCYQDECQEEIQGTREFTFWNILRDSIFDLRGLANDINVACRLSELEEL